MELTNEFTVDIPVDEAWTVLTDVTRIAPCMPGAQLHEVDGDEFRGTVKVKVGPITAEYRGKATFLEQDPVAHRAVLRAEGREARGQGNASATITATLEPVEGATNVSVVTDLTITGRVAQFGRGVLADISAKLLAQFAESLQSTVAGSTPADTTPPPAEPPGTGTPPAASGTGGPEEAPGAGTAEGTATGGTPSTASATVPDEPVAAVPVDLVKVVGPALLKRVVPLVAGVVVLTLWGVRFRRRH